MIADLFLAVGLTFPLVISGALHMFAVKRGLLSSLKRPISVSLFGENKTVRGFVLMPIFTVIGVALSLWIPFFRDQNLSFLQVVELGMGLGLFYSLAELPNSFVKRKLGVAPGKTPEKHTFLFAFVDQADSVVGCLVYYKIFFGQLTPQVLFLVFLLGPAIHLGANFSLYLLKLRKQPM